ncbi:MAG: hypothetical protein E7636_02600 [Ruminococcaceae bacterium]|nr:hypothetical protein [Oscillospiraceae bacterium]
MELYFSISPVPDPTRRDEILGAILATVPGASAEFSKDGTKIRVRIPVGADRLSVLDAITFRLLGLGYDVRELAYTPPQAPPITNIPQHYTKPQPRTVRLSVFIFLLLRRCLRYRSLALHLAPHLWGFLPMMARLELTAQRITAERSVL